MNSRSKGCRGEREWRDILRAMGCPEARRGRQYSGSPESPDVVGGWAGTHNETKRVERLNIYEAMAQAIADCGGDIPYVSHRKNGHVWLVTVMADDLYDFARAVLGIPNEKSTAKSRDVRTGGRRGPRSGGEA